jgi:cytochrome P450
VLLRHDLVEGAALDHTTFSSAVSRFLQVPNGLDGAEHGAFREVLDPFLSPAALDPFLEDFERIASDLVAALPRGTSVEALREIGATFAVRPQSAWLGWSPELENRLLEWIEENHPATRSGDVTCTRQVAKAFNDIIRSVLPARQGDGPSANVTAALLHVEVHGRRLAGRGHLGAAQLDGRHRSAGRARSSFVLRNTRSRSQGSW